MNKKEVIDFFDRLAPGWDADMIRHDARICAILDWAGVHEGAKILDVACGTGVLIPDYISRKADKIVGVDISSKMIEIARSKFLDSRVEFICADVEELVFDEQFDVCMIYNAIPHFESPSRLIAHLARSIKCGGRLTIAHGMSRKQIDAHHAGAASHVSHGLMPETELARLFEPYFTVDVCISNDEIYVVSGIKGEI